MLKFFVIKQNSAYSFVHSLSIKQLYAAATCLVLALITSWYIGIYQTLNTHIAWYTQQSGTLQKTISTLDTQKNAPQKINEGKSDNCANQSIQQLISTAIEKGLAVHHVESNIHNQAEKIYKIRISGPFNQIIEWVDSVSINIKEYAYSQTIENQQVISLDVTISLCEP